MNTATCINSRCTRPADAAFTDRDGLHLVCFICLAAGLFGVVRYDEPVTPPEPVLAVA